MELSASSGLWAFAFFCHIGILVSSESFTLKGSDSPVIATVGTDVILPCQLSPRTNAKQMEVRWHSSEIAGLTHHYVNGHDALQKQNPHYRGRTELFKEELPNGNVSLLLKKVQVADGGSYVCFIGNKLNYLESLVELKVGAVGTGPTISVHRSQDQGVTLTCSSEGWYPEPAIMWADRHGQRQNSTMLSVKDVQGLHNIQSHVDVKDNKSQVLVCRLQSNFWDQTRQSELQLSSDLFPYDKHPYVVTTVILCLSLVIFGVVTGFIFKTERESKGKLQIAKELLKARNSAVQIRADPNTAHPNLHISSDCLHVSHSDQKQEVTDTLERFDGWACVLGSETLRAGKEYYWEVYVGNKTDWDLGVTDGKANRKGWQNLKPENGYWGIRFFNSTDYIAFEDPEVKLKLGKQPKVVGIHLDGKAQRLDFYDVSDMSHIYTFSLKFPLDVYPYFCPGLNKNGKNKDPLNLCFLSHDYSDLMSSTSISSPHISTSELLEGTNGKDVAVEHSNLKNSDDATLPFLHQAPFIQKQEPSPQSGSMHKLCIGS
ncbi:butyrophilin subfamily 1 member A1 isoform X1 [Chelonia mydas]|uniref:butyrophilin subfamily 1 member A1 isoform X1 n=1 Tax=Chelonia mydas TaxID=8469 RepID=UPI0018A23640|nr:butyrophilin subfamily 1 member A1 isoform X1 [Chelonia mydas]XP_043400915.1 butyrophilin subfamily 1 member A1 isoform X1 [Chelonia mydas]XP_043400916.1 butyrophilin subfamily 1 member A1 isoform X1 [Chelonia mydas]